MIQQPATSSSPSDVELLRLLKQTVAVVTVSPERRVVGWSVAASRLLVIAEQEALGQTASKLLAGGPTSPATIDAAFDSALKNGSHELEVWRDTSGGRSCFRVMIQPLASDSATSAGLCLTLEDCTAAKKSEARFNELDAKFRSVVQSNTIGVGFWDLDGRITDANDLLLSMLGYSRQDLEAGHIRWSDLTPPEFHQLDKHAIEQLRGAGACTPYEKEYMRKDGVRLPVLIGASLVDGDATRGSFWVLDNAERKKIEQSLLLQSHVLESMTEGVSLADANGTIVYTNAAEDRIFGYERGELVGQHVTIQNTYPPQENERIVAEIIAQLKTRGSWSGEFENRKKDGAPFRTFARITALQLEGQPHWVCVQEDITERTRALEELASHEQRLQLALEAGRMGTWDWNIQTGKIQWSENLLQMHGLTAETFDGTLEAFQRLIHPDDQVQVQQAIEDSIANRTAYDVEFRIVWPDGSIHWIAGRGKAFYDVAGVPTHMVGIGADINERQEAAERLRQSEDRFRAMMEQAPFSIQILSPDGKTVQVNRAWQELWGATFEKLADYNILLDPQLREKGLLDYLERAFSGEAVAIPAAEYNPNETIPELSHHDDPVRYVSAMAYPLKDHQGRVREVVLTHEDITARVRAEAALRESEERFRGIVSHSIAGVAEVDLTGKFLFANDRYCKIVGRSLTELLTLRMQDISHPDDLVENLLLFERMVHDGTAYIIEKRYLLPDGSEVWVNNSVSGLRTPKGSIRSIVAVCVDITARRLAEQSLREADRRKDEFLAMLGHELRNPLAPIRSGLELLSMEHAESDVISLMRSQVDHLVRLVDELLDVSRIMRGKITLRRQPIELSKIVAQAIETARPLIDGQQQQLTRSLPPEPVWLDADPVRMTQVFSNLLNNAAKYTPRDGQIWIMASARDGVLQVRIRDNGMGIEPELLPQMFHLFTQGERAIDRSQGGLGIGLTVVKSLVEMHGGTVTARSEGLGRGSEFLVQLPVLATHTAELPPPTIEPTKTGYRILLVDDNVPATKLLKLLLTKLGPHEIAVAHDGPSALAALEMTRPQLVLLDIGLPGMSGFEVARRIRANAANDSLLLVAVTGYGAVEDRQESRAAGFDEHLVKPVDVEALRRVTTHPKLSATKR